jgi:adenosylcobyric acid synthase
MAACVMIQGTGSNVGKSLIVAGLARAFARRGLRVMPFKPQNMSNNAAVTADGGEIGRAQALQARAAGIEPLTDMNPVLLKPESERGAQVVLCGRRLATVAARDYARLKPDLMPPVLAAFERLSARADLVLVEGAGSPAEVNLRANDIANMGFAAAARVPVVLVGDIDRGGVIAQLVGTAAVLDPADAARIRGFVVNRFRGDPALFDDGYRLIAARTGWRGLGVVPWFDAAARLPAEDALDLAHSRGAGPLRIAVPRLARIANFDDLDPLAQEPDVTLDLVGPGRPIPVEADLVILPGSKATRADLALIREEGWDIDIRALLRRGGRVLGLCGGFQMLGRRVRDPQGIEGPPGDIEGLGLLDIETVMLPEKRLERVAAHHVASGEPVSGYEIHVGRSDGPDRARPLFSVAGRPEGAVSADGAVAGTYLHGIFASDGFRAAFLAALGARSAHAHAAAIEATLDSLADHLEAHLDCDGLLEIAHSR